MSGAAAYFPRPWRVGTRRFLASAPIGYGYSAARTHLMWIAGRGTVLGAGD